MFLVSCFDSIARLIENRSGINLINNSSIVNFSNFWELHSIFFWDFFQNFKSENFTFHLKFFEFFSLKLLELSPEGTEVSRALYLLLILCKKGFKEAQLAKIDTKFDKKKWFEFLIACPEIIKIEKNPKKSKILN